MNKIDLNITSVEIKAKSSSVRSTWTRAMAKDLEFDNYVDNAYFEHLLAKEIRKQIRKTSISKIFKM